jgi:hypothetical protein
MILTSVLRQAMHDIAKKKGEFSLFAMVMRTETSGRWELVVSAPWLETGKLKAVAEFVRLLSESIGEESLHEFTRIATLPSNSDFLKFVTTNAPSIDRELRIRSSDFFARGIEEAIIFQAKRPAARRSTPVSRRSR